MDITVTDLKILPMGKSDYVKPFRMEFMQNGKRRIWDCVKVHNSVSIMLYHKEKDAFLFVKQFRPAVWYSQENLGYKSDEQGFTYELCAGLMDKGLSEEQTIREEVLEEVGYEIDAIEKITMCYTAFGFGGGTQTMFYACIDESMRVNDGGGVAEEAIELVFIERAKMHEFAYDESKVKGFGFMYAHLWWQEKFGNLKDKK
ncbi:hypothetical protein LMG7974_01353 [Campylobacter majalis]|uniref:Nudix hydrolase domain-containing protein n=1 Tax=Campylobacter majalis TaxID=2790656 RepID=A0ABM8Q805_9BACT|nr:NUDIX domain-containing protein [Campylobacter majalis]CAD7289122.1 hypothetical protein LMG7974_01353 [Campylobacter majalis]